MQLRDAGAVDLGAPVAEYVPELADAPRDASRTCSRTRPACSGRSPARSGSRSPTSRTTSCSRASARSARVLEPRDEYHYSNLGFMLLGEIVARASGTPYTTYVEEWLFAPVGLDGDDLGAATPAAAVGYHLEPWTRRRSRRGGARPRAGPRRRASSGAPPPTSRAGPASSATPIPTCCGPETAAEMRRVQTIADHAAWKRGSGLGLLMWRDGDRALRGAQRRHERLPLELRLRHARPHGRSAPHEREHHTCRSRRSAWSSPRKAAEGSAPPPEPWRPAEAPPAELDGVLGNWWTEGWEFVLSYRDGALQAQRRPARPPTPPSSSASAPTATWACRAASAASRSRSCATGTAAR